MTALSYTRSWARAASSTCNVGSIIAPSIGSPSIAARTRAGNWLRKPLGSTRPNVFRMPRTQFFSVVICDTIWARATSSARTAWQSRPFTVTSRYQPTRMICARPRASLASVLLTFSDSAALAWRASTQITGTPACFNPWNNQFDNCPLSRPIRTAWGACCVTADTMASGVVSTWPRHTILSASSMTQIDVCFRDTSRPTYWLPLDMVSLLWRYGGTSLFRQSLPRDYAMSRPGRHPSSGRLLCRSHSARREAGRSPGAVSDKIRDGREPQDRQGARSCHTPIDPAARHGGDRVVPRHDDGDPL